MCVRGCERGCERVCVRGEIDCLLMLPRMAVR